jgi:hypothetical protein
MKLLKRRLYCHEDLKTLIVLRNALILMELKSSLPCFQRPSNGLRQYNPLPSKRFPWDQFYCSFAPPKRFKMVYSWHLWPSSSFYQKLLTKMQTLLINRNINTCTPLIRTCQTGNLLSVTAGKNRRRWGAKRKIMGQKWESLYIWRGGGGGKHHF